MMFKIVILYIGIIKKNCLISIPSKSSYFALVIQRTPAEGPIFTMLDNSFEKYKLDGAVSLSQ